MLLLGFDRLTFKFSYQRCRPAGGLGLMRPFEGDIVAIFGLSVCVNLNNTQ